MSAQRLLVARVVAGVALVVAFVAMIRIDDVLDILRGRLGWLPLEALICVIAAYAAIWCSMLVLIYGVRLLLAAKPGEALTSVVPTWVYVFLGVGGGVTYLILLISVFVAIIVSGSSPVLLIPAVSGAVWIMALVLVLFVRGFVGPVDHTGSIWKSWSGEDRREIRSGSE